MKKIIIFLVLVFFLNNLSAQTNNSDYILLKDSSLIKGTVVKYKEGNYIVLRTSFGENLRFYPDDILDIKFSVTEFTTVPIELPSKISISLESELSEGGYFNDASLVPAIHVGLGYTMKKGTYLGLYTGFDGFEGGGIPLAFQARQYLGFLNNNCFLYTDGGAYFFSDGRLQNNLNYNYENYNDNLQSYMANAGIGAEFRRSSNSAFYVSLGYRYQYVHGERINYYDIYPFDYYPNYTETYEANYHKFNIRVGFRFY